MHANVSFNSGHKKSKEEKHGFMRLFLERSKALLLFLLFASLVYATLVILHYFDIVPYATFKVAIALLTFSTIAFVIIYEGAYILREFREFYTPMKSSISSEREIVLRNEIQRLQQSVNELKPDAERYRKFLDAGLPICYLGVEYYDKATLDAAIDSTN